MLLHFLQYHLKLMKMMKMMKMKDRLRQQLHFLLHLNLYLY